MPSRGRPQATVSIRYGRVSNGITPNRNEKAGLSAGGRA